MSTLTPMAVVELMRLRQAGGTLPCTALDVGAIQELEVRRLMEYAGNGQSQLTERGQCLADHILRLPLPVASWEMPNG